MILGTGAAIGWPPSDTYAASLWELQAAVDGYNTAQGGDDDIEPMSDDEYDTLIANASDMINGIGPRA